MKRFDPMVAAEIHDEVVSKLRLTFEGYEADWPPARAVVRWESFEISGDYPEPRLIARFVNLSSGIEYYWCEELWDDRHPPQWADEVSAEAMFDNLVDAIREGLGSLWRDPDREPATIIRKA